jgi:hypothetical protein
MLAIAWGPWPVLANAPATGGAVHANADVDVDVTKRSDDGEDPDPDHDGPESKDWEVALSGAGRWNRDGGEFGESHYSLAAAIQYYVSEHIEPGFRQTIDWFDPENGSSRTTGTSRIALDVNFPMGLVRPFIGVSYGLAYGDDINGTDNLLAPEAGIKFYIGERAFLVIGIEFDAVFGSWSELDDAWNDADVLSTIGVGYYW